MRRRTPPGASPRAPVAVPGRSNHPRRWLVAALLLSSSGVGGAALAQGIDSYGAKVFEIEDRIRRLSSNILPKPPMSPDAVDGRLVDGQVLYELKNYDAAAVIFLDLVEKYPGSPVYPEALFFLSDSLFLKRDFFSARRYFEKVVEIGPTARRYPEALERLVELSLYTGDYTPVDGYIAKLATMPPTKQLRSVAYVKGKYYYFRQKFDDAAAAFKDIGKDHPYWFHSQYFVGASQVAQGKLDDAINTYFEILRVDAKSDSQKRIAELAHMALGRIFHDRGQLTNALAEYNKISQKSDLFADALYEQAWVAIKAKEYKRAYRALDLLLLTKPDDVVIPEVKLLMGNLHLREENYKEARESFNKTRDEFEPIKGQIEANLKTASGLYFKDLISRNLGKFDTATYLPPLAAKWVKAEPDIERLIHLVTDVGDLKKSLAESEDVLHRLEQAISGAQRINVFPELARARTQARELANQLGDVRGGLLKAERDILRPVMTAAEAAQMDEMAGKRGELEKKLGKRPQDADGIEAWAKKQKATFQELDKRATELNVSLSSYAAQRVAIDVYYRTTEKEQKADPAAVRRQLEEAAREEEELRKQYDDLRRDIADAIATVGVDDADLVEQEKLRKQLSELMDREHEMTGSMRARLSGDARVKADQIASILDRVRGSEASLVAANAKIDDSVEARLTDVRISIEKEKTQLAAYKQTLGGYEGETTEVGGAVTEASFKSVADRFYQIVVRADVGTIDVAWALKQGKTDEGAKLLREQKREQKLLEDEYKQVSKE